MNWDAVGAIAELAGALGVVTSLAYLGLQIRQNTRSSHTATYRSLKQEIQQFRAMLGSDPEVARIYRDGLRDFRSLNEDDQWRFGAMMQHLSSSFEDYFRLRGDSIMHDLSDEIRWVAARPGARDWWSNGQRLYEADFRGFIDDLIASESTASD